MSLLIPPLILKFRVLSSDSSGFRLWFPLFIFLPIFYFFIFIIALAMSFANLVYPSKGQYRVRRSIRAFIESFRMFHAIRGLTIEVNSKDSDVFIAIT